MVRVNGNGVVVSIPVVWVVMVPAPFDAELRELNTEAEAEKGYSKSSTIRSQKHKHSSFGARHVWMSAFMRTCHVRFF
jgi:hypothetical protein